MNNYLINPVKERQDNQFDLKVDHNLTDNNRFFTRYSYQKTHRLQPATLPHGDAGATFGAGDGNIKAQGLAFNDTHTFSSNWLNEFRFGWTPIKFFMTSIDSRAESRVTRWASRESTSTRHVGHDPAELPEHPEPRAPTATSRSSRTRTTSRSSTT